MISVQFSFSNATSLPAVLASFNEESEAQHYVRKETTSGNPLVAQPFPERCYIGELPQILADAGYVLVDATGELRQNPGNKCFKKYLMVRFLFAPAEFVFTNENFEAQRELFAQEFAKMCRDAMWRVRAFDNPFISPTGEDTGERALSLNLEVREPIFQPDGSPVLCWRKDGEGERIGSHKLPIKPNFKLKYQGEELLLAAV